MVVLKNETYHLVYHDLGEDTAPQRRMLQSSVAPKRFCEDLEWMKSVGQVVDAEDWLSAEGLESEHPKFVIWFDDAMCGVLEHGRHILKDWGIRPAVAAISRVAGREERFWRCELSALLELEGPEYVADLLNIDQAAKGTVWLEALNSFDYDLRDRIAKGFKDRLPRDLIRDTENDFCTEEDLFLSTN